VKWWEHAHFMPASYMADRDVTAHAVIRTRQPLRVEDWRIMNAACGSSSWFSVDGGILNALHLRPYPTRVCKRCLVYCPSLKDLLDKGQDERNITEVLECLASETA